MAGSSPSDKKIRTNPNWLSDSERAYYRTTWGFDPVADITYLGDGWRRLEIYFPLSQDPSLETIGVTIGARVDWFVEEIRNRIVFRRGDREAEVECTHTVVYAGPVSNALTYASDEITRQNLLSEEGQELINRAGGTVSLPPWEHFAALKSYVSAITEIGIITLFRQQIKAPIETGEGIPFGFNVEMQHQVIKAIQTVAPKAIDYVLQDLTRELLETMPPEWIITRWEILSIEKIFAQDLLLFSEWLRNLQKYISNPVLPSDMTQILRKLIASSWSDWLHMWDAETTINFFRLNPLSDTLQDILFNDVKIKDTLCIKSPTVPWKQLQLEWKARQVVKQCASEFGQLDAGWLDIVTDRWKTIPAVEIWPRAALYGFEFPFEILRQALGGREDPVARQKRVESFLKEVVEYYAKEEMMDFMVEVARDFKNDLPQKLTEDIPIEWQRKEIAKQKVDSNQQPEELMKHWDFTIRLALIVNPNTKGDTINLFQKDVQPSIRAVAEARLRRDEAIITPQIGEILSPGEILWLLASYPTKFFLFGATTWGDGSDSYMDWFKALLTRDTKWKNAIGEIYALAYANGLICEDKPENERGFKAMHLTLDGFNETICGHLPCIYLGPAENIGITTSIPDFSIAPKSIDTEKRREPSYFS